MLTDRDAEILVFINRFGVLCARHVIKHFSMNERVAYRRISSMMKEGYLHRRRVIAGRPKVLLLTEKAVRSVSTNHGRAKIRLQTIAHDLAVADVVLALAERHDWSFKTEREIRAERGGVSAKGHVPDAVFRTADSRQIALEVENSYKAARRHEMVIRQYIRMPAIDQVLFAVYNRQQADKIAGLAEKMKADRLVTVTTVREVLGGDEER